MLYVYGSMVHNVRGYSMLPTIQDHAVVVTLWPWGAPERGQIVVVEKEEEKRWIKRVVGLPGDRIVIEPGKGPVLVNGEPLEEPYLNPHLIEYIVRTDVTLGADEYFVLGDNRQDSYDSRYAGPIKADEILVTLDCWFQL
jgi:signal peptidase I